MPKKLGELTLYTVPDLEQLLQVNARTIREYLKEGKLKGRKFGREWHVTEQQLREYFEAGADPEDRK